MKTKWRRCDEIEKNKQIKIYVELCETEMGLKLAQTNNETAAYQIYKKRHAVLNLLSKLIRRRLLSPTKG